LIHRRTEEHETLAYSVLVDDIYKDDKLAFVGAHRHQGYPSYFYKPIVHLKKKGKRKVGL
jgi:hypothetical protein